MRMRRKKNLDDRLIRCSDVLIPVNDDEKNSLVDFGDSEYLDFVEIFGNNNPVMLEIGSGKGKFARDFAKQNPDINLIAIEKSKNVMVDACEKAIAENIPNLRFMATGAEYLERYFPKGSIERIYLNFSCPYPKKSYANRRLTNHRFLGIYENILRPQGEIHQKTDNIMLFDYSIEELTACGYTLKNVTRDLHNSGFCGNIMTEYEEKFSSEGKPICRLEAYKQVSDK